jgi:hypothetical protein
MYMFWGALNLSLFLWFYDFLILFWTVSVCVFLIFVLHFNTIWLIGCSILASHDSYKLSSLISQLRRISANHKIVNIPRSIWIMETVIRFLHYRELNDQFYKKLPDFFISFANLNERTWVFRSLSSI